VTKAETPFWELVAIFGRTHDLETEKPISCLNFIQAEILLAAHRQGSVALSAGIVILAEMQAVGWCWVCHASSNRQMANYVCLKAQDIATENVGSNRVIGEDETSQIHWVAVEGAVSFHGNDAVGDDVVDRNRRGEFDD
jgi:Zn finger protein HypA/HybF involved in hydrogenase expression